jgi:purine-binding chemotaxis protein CheW
MHTQALHETFDDTETAPGESRLPNQFVTFNCGSRAFGIDIMAVREIRSWAPVTELPQQPFGATGVLDIRGSIVQVFDLITLLGGESSDREDRSAQVVLVVSLTTQDVGLLVDSVSDIIFAQGDELRSAPRADGLDQANAVLGLVKKKDLLIAILDLKALFPAETQH